jgi:hypothetical protein
MSSQAREKSALKIDLQICVIPLATTVALILWYYVTLVAVVSMCSYDAI